MGKGEREREQFLSPLVTLRRSMFVGRRQELDALGAQLDEALEGRG